MLAVCQCRLWLLPIVPPVSSRPKLDYASDLSVMSLLSVSNIQQQPAPPRRTAPCRTAAGGFSICWKLLRDLCKFAWLMKVWKFCKDAGKLSQNRFKTLTLSVSPGLSGSPLTTGSCSIDCTPDWWTLQPKIKARVCSLRGRPASGNNPHFR